VPKADSLTTFLAPALVAARMVAKSCAGIEGPGALSKKTASMPSSARTRDAPSVKSPRTTSTMDPCRCALAGSRVMARTGAPTATSWRTTSLPMVPVEPVIRNMAGSFRSQYNRNHDSVSCIRNNGSGCQVPSRGAPVSAKPLRADARRNRERVLEVAQALFSAGGAAVEMDEIARRAGVGVGTVYRHFPTKEALFSAIVDGTIERLVADARALAKASDPGEAFFEFLSRLVERGAAKKHLVDVMARGGFAVDCAPPGRQEARAAFRRALALLLARGQRAGVVRQDIAVAELLALISGTFTALEQYETDARARRRLLAVVCDGLRGRPSHDRRRTGTRYGRLRSTR
jgi:AcrR family transcriptional regulator